MKWPSSSAWLFSIATRFFPAQPNGKIETEYYVVRDDIQSDYSRRSYQQLVGDVNAAHSVSRKLAANLTSAENRLGWQNVWIRVLTAAVVAEFTIIGWLVKAFLEQHR